MNVIIYHNGNSVSSIEGVKDKPSEMGKSIVEVCLALASKYPEAMLCWCHVTYASSLNIDAINEIIHHNKMMVSYIPKNQHFLGSEIGFVEFSPYIKVQHSKRYPTWLMSSCVGVVPAKVLNAVSSKISTQHGFDYFLNSVSKLSMPKGLLCYHDPNLLIKNTSDITLAKASTKVLFKFVKQHYITAHFILLLLNFIIYRKRFPLFSFLLNVAVKKKTLAHDVLANIQVCSSKKVIKEQTIDVIIPTIGRKKYLYDVLKDFSSQTILPKKIIIVEQHPDPNSFSELDYLHKEQWPFEIKHVFTHKLGVCNARNIALDNVTHEWVYFADDDIRFEPTFIEDVFSKIAQFGNEIMTTASPQKNEPPSLFHTIQWATFGTGNSFVKNEILKKGVRFNMALEFGYGEDKDFGMQLRNQGADIIYLPEPKILHLKAPIGGFRFKHVKPWQNDKIIPKPSPTVLLFQKLHYTESQFLGFKTTYFLKRILKNRVTFSTIKKEWNQSMLWANKLIQ